MNKRTRPFTFYLRDPIAFLWHFWASPRLSLFLLGVCTVAVLAALLLPQAPPQAQGDSATYGRWLVQVRNRFGASTDLMQTLGLFDILGSFGFRLLLVALAFNLIISTAQQINSTWMVLRRGIPLAESEASLAPLVQADMNLERQLHWRSVLRLLPPVGGLLILASLFIAERWGWREIDLPLSEGQTYAIEHSTALSLRAEAVAVSLRPDGKPADWKTRVVLLHDSQEVHRGVLGFALPLYYRGLVLYQSAVGPSINIVAEDEKGQSVALQTIPPQSAGLRMTSVRFRSSGDEAYVSVPDRNLNFRLTYYSSLPQRGEQGPVVHAQAYRGGEITPVWDVFLRDKATWTTKNATYHLRREHYAIIQIAFVPELPLVILGFLLVILGTLGLCCLFILVRNSGYRIATDSSG